MKSLVHLLSSILLALTILSPTALTNPLHHAHTPIASTLQPSLHPRMEHLFQNRWHLILDRFSPSHYLAPTTLAFRGFEYFLHSLAQRLATQALDQPPNPFLSITIGSLRLIAESTTDDPIAWETMDWLVEMLAEWVQRGWTGFELDAWLTDEWTERAVKVSLRVMGDGEL